MKDETEQKVIRTAATITVAVMKNFVIQKIEGIIDEEKKVRYRISDFLNVFMAIGDARGDF